MSAQSQPMNSRTSLSRRRCAPTNPAQIAEANHAIMAPSSVAISGFHLTCSTNETAHFRQSVSLGLIAFGTSPFSISTLHAQDDRDGFEHDRLRGADVSQNFRLRTTVRVVVRN